MNRLVIFVVVGSSLLGASFVGQRHLERRETVRDGENLQAELQLLEVRSARPASIEQAPSSRSATRTLAELEAMATALSIDLESIEGAPRSDDSGLVDYRVSGIADAKLLTRWLVGIEVGERLPVVTGLTVEGGDPGGTRFRLELVGEGLQSRGGGR